MKELRKRPGKEEDRMHETPDDSPGFHPSPLETDPIRKDKSSCCGGCCTRLTRWMQNTSYDWMAYTFWDKVVSGFAPARTLAMELLDIQETDCVLLVGEGSGLDFAHLPPQTNTDTLMAFDFSSEMVKQSKLKAPNYGIPVENCFQGDAQALPFENEKFDKILFPLSLASIPNPTLALQEAERVLAEGGRIVIFDKMVDDQVKLSSFRQGLNFVTSATFADINRNLTQMMGEESPLKVIHYDSLSGKLSGKLSNLISGSYRLACLVRTADYPDTPAVGTSVSP